MRKSAIIGINNCKEDKYMPSQYAHNKFGKLVIPNLHPFMKSVIKKYPRAFRIGLQGPDFLFFNLTHKNVYHLGQDLHHMDAYGFMEHAIHVIREFGLNSPQYSYIMGFICHFVLDSSCHPYINKFMKSTGCGHVEIEGDLENLIMSSENLAPEFYPLYKLVPTDFDTAFAMSPFYKGISILTIQDSLIWMKRLKKLFVAPSDSKRKLINFGFHASFHYDKLNGHMVLPHANEKCRKETIMLYDILKLSVDDAVKLINNFTLSLNKISMLSNEFHRDFSGNIW